MIHSGDSSDSQCGCDNHQAHTPITSDLSRQTVEEVVRRIVNGVLLADESMTVPIEVSARHLHITNDDLQKLFGPGYQLSKLRDLNQPGEFAAKETVSVVGPKRRMLENVRILGPTRSITQVELSHTDGIYLGIDLPHRLSGDIKNSAPILLVGPHGSLQLKEGAIRAMRHIHISPEQARLRGLKKDEKVSIQTRGPMQVTFDNVIIRTAENLNLAMHIDTDEANAAGIQTGQVGVIIKDPQ